MTEIKNHPKRAVFDFENYEISEFKFKKSELVVDTFSIGFNPSGKFIVNESVFIISLGFNASFEEPINKDLNEVISLIMNATFRFDDVKNLDDIPDYFYRNALGIMFPYLRAFVSTMTFQANLRPPMILPILNLMEIEQPLRDNIQIVEK